MRRVYQIGSLAFFALSVFVVFESRTLSYYAQLGLDRLGPGPGFFPFWLGLLSAVLSLIWFAQVSLRPVEPMPVGFFPDRGGSLRVLSILLALVLYTVLVGLLGFTVTTFCFALFLLVALGRQNPVLTLAVAVAGSFGVYYLFRHVLEVPLPASSIEFLQDLGL